MSRSLGFPKKNKNNSLLRHQFGLEQKAGTSQKNVATERFFTASRRNIEATFFLLKSGACDVLLFQRARGNGLYRVCSVGKKQKRDFILDISKGYVKESVIRSQRFAEVNGCKKTFVLLFSI